MHGEGNLPDVTQQLSGRAGNKTHLSIPKHVTYLPLLRRFKYQPQDTREGERIEFSKASLCETPIYLNISITQGVLFFVFCFTSQCPGITISGE